MRKSFVLFFCVVLLSGAQSQVVVMDETVTPLDTVRPDLGPNGKRMFNTVMGFHLVIPTEVNDRAPVSLGASNGFRIGYVWKYRLNNVFSLGYMVDFNTFNFRYKQNTIKDFPDTIIHQSQSVGINTLGAAVFFRINFDAKRGNIMGHYLDLGAYADLNISRYYRTKDENDLDEIIRTRVSRLSFIEKYQYGVYAAIGLNRFVLYGRYRFSDVFNSPYMSAEPPRLNVGIGFSIF
ncbi:MAG: hypothetical protein CVU11_14600 [Bacteroidetes bacterium HGW-Bacteroidetes-6]|jgi:hypothetical protein|nr:MAG: hypothetical protein CVU11_14600 [Bacteroidetes bacterium HGW-Bacteroidetes-6]